MFGGAFPCLGLEAKYSDGPQNGAFEAELRSGAVSAARVGAAQEATQRPGFGGTPWGGSERRKARGRESAAGTGQEFLGSSTWAVAACLCIN